MGEYILPCTTSLQCSDWVMKCIHKWWCHTCRSVRCLTLLLHALYSWATSSWPHSSTAASTSISSTSPLTMWPGRFGWQTRLMVVQRSGCSVEFCPGTSKVRATVAGSNHMTDKDQLDMSCIIIKPWYGKYTRAHANVYRLGMHVTMLHTSAQITIQFGCVPAAYAFWTYMHGSDMKANDIHFT